MDGANRGDVPAACAKVETVYIERHPETGMADLYGPPFSHGRLAGMNDKRRVS